MTRGLHVVVRGPLDVGPSLTAKLLPHDVGDVSDPGNAWQCWAVMRQTKVDTTLKFVQPRQCQSRRQGARHKGDERPYCCRQHAKFNEAAEALAKGKK